ncbi:hypothetical protein AVEN_167679-1, partial [Araneus ventricosus]
MNTGIRHFDEWRNVVRSDSPDFFSIILMVEYVGDVLDPDST